jgi:hypothetical protein
MAWVPLWNGAKEVLDFVGGAGVLVFLGHAIVIQRRKADDMIKTAEGRLKAAADDKQLALREKDVELRKKDVTIEGLENDVRNWTFLAGPDMSDRVAEAMLQVDAARSARKNMAQRLEDTADDLNTMLSGVDPADWTNLKTVECPAAEIEQRDADMAAYLMEQEVTDTAQRENVRNLLLQFGAVAGFVVDDE